MSSFGANKGRSKPRKNQDKVDVEGFFSMKERQARKSARAKKRQEEKDEQRATRPKKDWNALNYVVWLLARREYSRAELSVKLARKFEEKELDPSGIEQVLDRAVELGLQSDQRFLESKVRVQKNQGKGPAYIRAHLRQHDLVEEEVSAALDPDENDWLSNAYDLAERKFGSCPYDRKTGTKVFNLLLRRGFSFDQAKKVVNTPRSEAND